MDGSSAPLSHPATASTAVAATDPSGDATAELELATLRRQLERAVRKVCPPSLADRAEDLVQTALLKVMDRHRANPDRTFNATYLYRTAHSALIDEIRRLKRRGEESLDDDEGEPKPLATERPDPEHGAAGRQLGRAIADCLGRLVTPRRWAVSLHLQGHSVPEAADLLDWKRKRVENLVYRGLADLRLCLDTKGFAP
ncbi:MAG: RNA polymerase sigma factor [Acidobacteriota bacterium]